MKKKESIREIVEEWVTSREDKEFLISELERIAVKPDSRSELLELCKAMAPEAMRMADKENQTAENFGMGCVGLAWSLLKAIDETAKALDAKDQP